MSSDPNAVDPKASLVPVQISAFPEGRPEAGARVGIAGNNTTIKVGNDPGALMVPPEILSSLTPDQVSALIDVAKAKNEQDHAKALAEMNHQAKNDEGFRGLMILLFLALAVFIGFAAYQGRFDVAEKAVLPIVTAIAGFFAGKGYERSKK